jgi:putative ABC transport system permease protein
MILGIVLGVAMAVSIDIANASAERAFDLSAEAVTGRTTHQIVGGPGGLPESVYTALRINGISGAAAPIIHEYVTSPELGDRTLQLLGVDPFVERDFRPYLAPDMSGQSAEPGASSALLTEPGTILISAALANEFRISSRDSDGFQNESGLSDCDQPEPAGRGCEISLQIAGRTKLVRIAGFIELPDDGGSTGMNQQLLGELLLTDIASAQELTGRLGLLDRIDLILPETCIRRQSAGPGGAEPGCPEARRILEILPPGANLVGVEARTGNIAEMASAFQLNLTALSLLASIVGVFLIYNTMTFSVLQRRPIFGILRTIGATRAEIFRLVLIESLLVGVAGAVTGVGLGILLGQGAVRLVTQTINDLYYVVAVRGVQVPGMSLIKGFVLGIGMSVISAILPAWEAAAASPGGVLARVVIEEKANRAVSTAGRIGAMLLLVGAAFLGIPSSSPIPGFLGTFAILVGFALLAPITTMVLMQTLIRFAGRKSGVLTRLAPREVVQSLSRTSIAVAALTVAISVTIGISMMVSSFRQTIISWLDETLLGDIYVSVPAFAGTGSTAAVDPMILRSLHDRAGVAQVDSLRSVDLASPQGPIHIAATDNPTLVDERIFLSRIGTLAEVNEALDAGSILISEPLARRLDLAAGVDHLKLDTKKGPKDFPIAGIYSDYASSRGTAMMRLSTYRENWNDAGVSALAIRLAAGADASEIAAQLLEEFSPFQRLQIRPNLALRQDALEVFDRTFAITRALRLLALIVAFIGVLSALLAWQLEKQREAGILRAVGFTTRQISELILVETGLMGIVAGVLAIPTGFALALILIYIINLRSFGWTLQLHVEASPFILALLLSLVASISAGVIPAIKLSRIRPAEVLRME